MQKRDHLHKILAIHLGRKDWFSSSTTLPREDSGILLEIACVIQKILPIAW